MPITPKRYTLDRYLENLVGRVRRLEVNRSPGGGDGVPELLFAADPHLGDSSGPGFPGDATLEIGVTGEALPRLQVNSDASVYWGDGTDAPGVILAQDWVAYHASPYTQPNGLGLFVAPTDGSIGGTSVAAYGAGYWPDVTFSTIFDFADFGTWQSNIAIMYGNGAVNTSDSDAGFVTGTGVVYETLAPGGGGGSLLTQFVAQALTDSNGNPIPGLGYGRLDLQGQAITDDPYGLAGWMAIYVRARDTTFHFVHSVFEVHYDGTVVMAALPTSSAGLPSGALWNNSGVVNIV